MQKSSRSLFDKVILALFLGLTLITSSVYSQNSSSFKVTNLRINDKKPVMPGSFIASCIVEENGDIPYKRYALIYIDYDGSSNNLKLVLEKTAIQWGGWGWVEIPWFGPVAEKKSCLASLGGSECVVAMAGGINIKLRLIDGLGAVSAQKETAQSESESR